MSELESHLGQGNVVDPFDVCKTFVAVKSTAGCSLGAAENGERQSQLSNTSRAQESVDR